MRLYVYNHYALTMTRAKRHNEALKSLDVLKVAIEPWNIIIQELRADRGMLLGSAQYDELNGVEKCEALSKIDDKIIDAREFIEIYEKNHNMTLKRLRIKGGTLNE
tara:strand:- start:554 stop:871 length:318 start_codon:yes stop_codon:yes gene_type:complete